MSLLLDALKRAEQEKLAKQGDRPADAARPAAAHAPPSPTAANLELAPMHGGGAAAASPPHAARSDAATAQTVFQAKTGGAPAANEPKKATIFWIAGGVIVLVIAAIGGYVWYSVQSMRPTITTLRPRAAPTPPPSSAPEPAPPKIESFVPQPVPPRTEASAPPAAAPPPPVAPPVAAVTLAPAQEMAANVLKERGAAASAATPPPAPLHLAPTQAREPAAPRVPSSVASGYEQLRDGRLAEAKRNYAAALAADGGNIDAHLGMATVEARLGNSAAAASHYRRALDLDPRNATAVAGLASLADYAQPDALESQLRGDIGRYPQSAALHFSLGNLYASQSRWHDAQAAFFEAHRLEPASADIAYNVAVSLDHLGQSRLAADYYRRALDAARTQATQFDPAPVARRLAELGR